MYKVTNEVINLIIKAMKNRKVELVAGRQTLAEVKIPREFFQIEPL